MCVTNVYVDRYPDWKEVEFRQTSYCQYGEPGRPCSKLSTLENPIREIEFGEPSTEFIMTGHTRSLPPAKLEASPSRSPPLIVDDRRENRQTRIPSHPEKERRDRVIVADSRGRPITQLQTASPANDTGKRLRRRSPFDPQRNIGKTPLLKFITTLGDKEEKSKFFGLSKDERTPIGGSVTPIAESASEPSFALENTHARDEAERAEERTDRDRATHRDEDWPSGARQQEERMR
jgi:hypothetical protein